MSVGDSVAVMKRAALAGAMIALAWWLVGAASAQAQSTTTPAESTTTPAQSTATPEQTTTTLQGDLVLALPAALPTGLSTGAGVALMVGDALAWGARASWSTATENTLVWEVDHDDVRLRFLGALQQAAGRGTFGLRLALGGTLVHETRTRAQGERAGLTGDDLQTTAWQMLPAADLEAVVRLSLNEDWSVVISGGPSLHLLSGDPLVGWTSSLGIGWEL